MTTPGEVQTGAHQKATAAHRDELSGARLFASDVTEVRSAVRVVFRLTDDAYGRVIAKVFGIPQEQQTVLVKLIMTNAFATVLGGYAASRLRRIRPSGADTATGGAVLHTALRGIAGAPSQKMPAAGVLVGLALLVRGLRSAKTVSSRDVHEVVHEAEVLVHEAEARYGHHPSTSVAADRTARP